MWPSGSPPNKRIRAIRLTESVPRSPSGKLLRRLLVEAERGRSD
jgi:acyl-CoA synthetase (AMP-forming)/AMP-acid ligase II